VNDNERDSFPGFRRYARHAVKQDAPMTLAAPARSGSCSCGRIDVHSHFLPAPYQLALQKAGLIRVDGGIPLPQWSATAHLQMMDDARIGTSILSISSPGLHFLDAHEAAAVARDVNIAGAELVAAHPERFGLFAVLPLQDVKASLDEIAFAFDVLKVDGIGLETNSRGIYLGDPRYGPIFDELDRRGALVFLHPTSPECLEHIGMGFPGPLIEFPFDTARSVVSLVFSGVLRHRRNIRLILSHGGGALPILLSRIAAISQVPFITPRPAGGAEEVIDEVRRMYFDLALSATNLSFNALLELTDIEHILFGSDYPFATPEAIAANTSGFDKIANSLPVNQREMIEYENAMTLLPRLVKLRAKPG
jgi:predicted TIM-barrel fold metal-dependent hydrolase